MDRPNRFVAQWLVQGDGLSPDSPEVGHPTTGRVHQSTDLPLQARVAGGADKLGSRWDVQLVMREALRAVHERVLHED